MYYSTKMYGHEIGLSCAFRQWRAHDSHCKFLHGYALAIKIVFAAEELDVRNWVVDFGGLKSFKQLLENTFDHKTLVASDDPKFFLFQTLEAEGLIQMVEVEKAGCEAFAELIHSCATTWLYDNGYGDRVHVHSVEVKEHGANSAIYQETPSASRDTERDTEDAAQAAD